MIFFKKEQKETKSADQIVFEQLGVVGYLRSKGFEVADAESKQYGYTFRVSHACCYKGIDCKFDFSTSYLDDEASHYHYLQTKDFVAVIIERYEDAMYLKQAQNDLKAISKWEKNAK